MNKLSVLLQIGLFSYAGSVMAADDDQGLQGIWANLDSNDDGQISLMEFQSRDNNALAALDTDTNGVLTLDEFLNERPNMGMRDARRDRGGDGQRQPTEEQMAKMQEMRTQRATERFQAMDVDGDEIVTLDEFQAGVFAELDRDDNGVLTARELRRPRMGGPDSEGRQRRRPDPQTN